MSFYSASVSHSESPYFTEQPLLPLDDSPYSSPLPSLTWSQSQSKSSSTSSQNSPDDLPSPPVPSSTVSAIARRTRRRSATSTAHLNARMEPKKHTDTVIKRRKPWGHLLEKRMFSTAELSTMKAQERRKIYISSLEEHIDALHNQLLSHSLFPVPFERLERMRGINSQTTIAMIAAILRDRDEMQLKLLELEHSTQHICYKLNDSDVSSVQ